MCCVCLTDPREMMLKPCRHAHTCRNCTEAIMQSGNKRCPTCRVLVRPCPECLLLCMPWRPWRPCRLSVLNCWWGACLQAILHGAGAQ